MLKTGPNRKDFYTAQDGGLIQQKPEGSLAKRPGRTGISGYGPLDRDLRAQGEGLRRSNLERSLEIGWLRMREARGGGGRSPEQSSAAAGSPE